MRRWARSVVERFRPTSPTRMRPTGSSKRPAIWGGEPENFGSVVNSELPSQFLVVAPSVFGLIETPVLVATGSPSR